MAGKWITVVNNPHVCVMPDAAPHGAGPGSVWQCHCGQQWNVGAPVGAVVTWAKGAMATGAML